MEIVTSEFSSVIEDLIKRITFEDCIDDEEFRLFKEVNALPLGYDLYSFVFLKSNGEIVLFDFLNDVFSSDNSLQGLISAVVSSSKRYPQLQKFIPKRPKNADICVLCNGTKVFGQNISTEESARCVNCVGLGWTLAEEKKL